MMKWAIITIKIHKKLIICNNDLTENKIVDILYLYNYNYCIEIDNLNKDFTKIKNWNYFKNIFTNRTKQHIFYYLDIYNDHYIKIVLSILLDYIIDVNKIF